MKNYTLIAFCLLIAACSSKSSSRGFWDAFSNDSYVQVYRKWTKRDDIYSKFDMSAIADVTYFNEEVREAYVNAITSDYRLSEEAAKELAAEQLAENETYETFIISLRTRQYGWSNLGSKERLWLLQLENTDGSQKVSPASIRKISDKDERARQYYKQMDRFSETFKVQFPKQNLREFKEIVLHITGPLGGMEFSFSRPKEKVPVAEETSLP